MDRIISNDPTGQTPNGKDWFHQIAGDLAALPAQQRLQVEALIHALAAGTVTSEDVNVAMTQGGVTAVTRLVKGRVGR